MSNKPFILAAFLFFIFLNISECFAQKTNYRGELPSDSFLVGGIYELHEDLYMPGVGLSDIGQSYIAGKAYVGLEVCRHSLLESGEYKFRVEFRVHLEDSIGQIYTHDFDLWVSKGKGFSEQLEDIVELSGVYHYMKLELLDYGVIATSGNTITHSGVAPVGVKLVYGLEQLRNFNFSPDWGSQVAVSHRVVGDYVEISWPEAIGMDVYELCWSYLPYSAQSYDYNSSGSRVQVNKSVAKISLAGYESGGYLLYAVRGGHLVKEAGNETVIWSSWSDVQYGGRKGLLSAVQSYLALNKHICGIDSTRGTPSYVGRLSYGYQEGLAESGTESRIYIDGLSRIRQRLDWVSGLGVQGEEYIYDAYGARNEIFGSVPLLEDSMAYQGSLYLDALSGQAYNYRSSLYDSACNWLLGSVDSNWRGGYYRSGSHVVQLASSAYGLNPTATYRASEHYMGYESPLARRAWSQLYHDGSGRAWRMGGRGVDYLPGLGHELTYNYGRVSQEELDELLGTNAGYSDYYRKVSERDADGVVRLNYIGPNGKIVCSGYAGGAAELDSLSDVTLKTRSHFYESSLKPSSGSSIINEELLVLDGSGNYNLAYTLESRKGTLGCDNLCLTCKYKLSFSLYRVGMCEDWIWTHDEIIVGRDLCEEDSTLTLLRSLEREFSILPAGTYKLEKVVEVFSPPSDSLRVLAMESACLPPLDSFVASARQELRGGYCDWACESNCDTCGQEEKYCRSISKCSVYRDQMLSDVSPGGQYFEYILDSTGNYLSEGTLNMGVGSCLGEYESSPEGWGSGRVPYRYPLYPYRDDSSGALSSIMHNGVAMSPSQLPLDVFIRNWEESWASSLLGYHPEYCAYELLCPDSTDYEQVLNGVRSYNNAAQAGHLNPLGQQDGPGGGGASLDTYYDGLPNLGSQLSQWLSVYPGDSLGRSIWELSAELSCIGGNCANITFGQGDSAMLSRQWEIFRSLYLGLRWLSKWEYVSIERPLCISRLGLIGSNRLCGSNGGNWYGKHARIVAPLTLLSIDSMVTGVIYGADSVCESSCEASARYWVSKLAEQCGCGFSVAVLDSFRSDLQGLCMSGCPFGGNLWSTTVELEDAYYSNYLGGYYRSHRDLVDAYMNSCSGYQNGSGCNYYEMWRSEGVSQLSGSLNYCLLDSNLLLNGGFDQDSTDFLSDYLEVSNGCEDSCTAACVGVLSGGKYTVGTDASCQGIGLSGWGYRGTGKYLQIGIKESCPDGSSSTNPGANGVSCSGEALWAKNISLSEGSYEWIAYGRRLDSLSTTCLLWQAVRDSAGSLVYRKLLSVHGRRWQPHKLLFNVSTSGNYKLSLETETISEGLYVGIDGLSLLAVDTACCLNCKEIARYRSGIASQYPSLSPVSSGDRYWEALSGYILSQGGGYHSGLSLAEYWELNCDEMSSAISLSPESGLGNGSENIYSVSEGSVFQAESKTISYVFADTTALCASFPSEELSPCALQEELLSYQLGLSRYLSALDSMTAFLSLSYRQSCLSGLKESMVLNYEEKVGHFTLFSYDVLGQLIETVSPEGVETLDSVQRSQVVSYRNAESGYYNGEGANSGTFRMVPPHRLASRLGYGSSGIWWREEIDGGRIYSWYDSLGRQVMSQGSYQSGANEYLFKSYDNLGRLQMSGQCELGQVLDGSTGCYLWNPITVYGIDRGQGIVVVYEDSSMLNRMGVASMTKYADLDYPGAYISRRQSFYDVYGRLTGNRKYIGALSAMLDSAGPSTNLYVQEEYAYGRYGGLRSRTYKGYFGEGYVHRAHKSRYGFAQFAEEGELGSGLRLLDRVFYYTDGSLMRTELGDEQVQGLDYSYTSQGYKKGMNSSILLPERDMGGDGCFAHHYHGDRNRYVGRDILGYQLIYHRGDDKLVSNLTLASSPYSTVGVSQLNLRNFYAGGEVSGQVLSYRGNGDTVNRAGLAYNELRIFNYDLSRRTLSMRAYSHANGVRDNIWDNQSYNNGYATAYHYDGSGNLESLSRYGAGGILLDSLRYNYTLNNNQRKLSHQLIGYRDFAGFASNTDLGDPGPSQLYYYDNGGRLVKDLAEGLSISWDNLTNKVARLVRTGTANMPSGRLHYSYDVTGDRISKVYEEATGGIGSGGSAYSKRYEEYWVNVGNTRAHYRREYEENSGEVAFRFLGYDLSGVSGRVGYALLNSELYRYRLPGGGGNNTMQAMPSGKYAERSLSLLASGGNEIFGSVGANSGVITHQHTHSRLRYYNIEDHQGNVIAVLSDRRVGVDSNGDNRLDYYLPEVMESNGYYPFGMEQSGRRYRSGLNYRYGFQGEECDAEWKGEGNMINYSFRMYDSRLGRFLSLDPLSLEYAHNSPYAFSENRLIGHIELEGLESSPITLTDRDIASLTQGVQSMIHKNSPGVESSLTALGILRKLLWKASPLSKLEIVYYGAKMLLGTKIAPLERIKNKQAALASVTSIAAAGTGLSFGPAVIADPRAALSSPGASLDKRGMERYGDVRKLSTEILQKIFRETKGSVNANEQNLYESARKELFRRGLMDDNGDLLIDGKLTENKEEYAGDKMIQISATHVNENGKEIELGFGFYIESVSPEGNILLKQDKEILFYDPNEFSPIEESELGTQQRAALINEILPKVYDRLLNALRMVGIQGTVTIKPLDNADQGEYPQKTKIFYNH